MYDIVAFKEFCRIDLGRQGVPDATMLLNFRHQPLGQREVNKAASHCSSAPYWRWNSRIDSPA
jgi:hypothetical protein